MSPLEQPRYWAAAAMLRYSRSSGGVLAGGALGVGELGVGADTGLGEQQSARVRESPRGPGR